MGGNLAFIESPNSRYQGDVSIPCPDTWCRASSKNPYVSAEIDVRQQLLHDFIIQQIRQLVMFNKTRRHREGFCGIIC